MAILAVLLVPLTNAVMGAWRSQAVSLGRFRTQEDAQRTLQQMVEGARPGPSVGGLRAASDACVQDDNPACAGGVVFLVEAARPNQVVTYYLAGSRLYRKVCSLFDPGCDLLVHATGGQPVLDGVETFQVRRDPADRLTLTLALDVRPRGPGLVSGTQPATFRLASRVRLRNGT